MAEKNMEFSSSWLTGGPPVPVVPAPPTQLPPCSVPVMVSLPSQPWETPYEADIGLGRGTIFPVLDLPFAGKGECRYE